MIQAILFDFNGVIIDDEPLHMKAYVEVLGAEGVALTEENYYTMLGMDDVTFVRTAFERAGKSLSDETMHAVIERELEAHRKFIGDAPPLFPGVVTFVKALAREFPLGVVSMARRDEIDYVLEQATLARYFSVIVSAEDERPCKPDPYCYNSALELLNAKRSEARVLPLRPNECLVIEDSPPGIESA
jgi:HAD superfamily hydrolase (TIGR01509 family)